MSKKNAVEYLREHISCTEIPISEIIKFVISKDGKYSRQEKDQLFESLVQRHTINLNSSVNVVDFIERTQKEIIPKVRIDCIRHKKGVNALLPNQEINFSDSLTVIYGLNGSGKSGYFRVLNELVGASIQAKIVTNIYSKENNDFEIGVDLHQDGSKKSITWTNNDARGVRELQGVQVFDSLYFPTYLNERETEVDLEPFGLHLFEHVTKLINEFKHQLDNKIQDINDKNNFIIDKLFLNLKSEEIRSLLKTMPLSKEQENILIKSCFSSQEDKTRLLKFKQQVAELDKENSGDAIKLKKQQLSVLKNLINWIKIESEFLSSIVNSSKETIRQNSELQKIRSARLQEFEAITKLPNYRSDVWYQFIKSGSDYRKSLGNNHNDKHCLYCKQPLQEEAFKLISNYTEFLRDESEEKLKNSNRSIDTIIKSIKGRNKHEINELLDNVLSSEIKNLVESIIGKYSDISNFVISSLEEKKFSPITYPDISLVKGVLEPIQNKLQSDISNLSDSSKNKQDRIKKLNNIIVKLEDRLFLLSKKEEVSKVIENKKEEIRLQNLSDKLKTREISELSKKAHTELLTSTMSQEFNSQIQAIKPNLKVELKSRNRTGTNLTKLQIFGHDIKSILSEGEQKSVALAIFLAELKCQKTTSPVIFDDPVTSLDHEIIDAFAKQLLNISVDRQVIVFTHNKLFLDSLTFWSGNNKDSSDTRTHHLCKNYGSLDCSNIKGRHVRIYELKTLKFGQSGSVYPAKLLSCDYFLQRSNKLINDGASYSEVAPLLKNAIEHFIDENIIVTKPLSDRRRGINILWEELQKVGEKKNLIPDIQKHWNTLSSRGSHASSQSSENPVSYQELNEIVDFLSRHSQLR